MNEDQPAKVGSPGVSPSFPKLAGKAQDPWDWVERSIWTERRLKRLAASQESTVWYSLWDKVCDPDNLDQAILKVIFNKGAPGVDGYTTEQVQADWERQRDQLRQELLAGTYRPKPARRVWIPKMGSAELRPLGIPAVRDRVVQTALRAVLEPILEQEFAAQSYGFRPQRGAVEALHQVEKRLQAGYCWIVDVDLKQYFDTIPHGRLLELLRRRIADGKVLRLLEQYLAAGVMESHQGWKPTDTGTPQGAVISPLLANLYLNDLDHQMAAKGYELVRYAEDFVVCAQTEQAAQAALSEIAEWVKSVGLKLHPTKTRVVNAATKGGFDFLGYHFEQYHTGGGKKWPRQKSEVKLREKLREKLPRNHGGSVAEMVAEANKTLRGWYGYFKYSLTNAMQRVDEWTRERIRHILRRRHRRRGMVRGRERTEYPIAWFERQGLFSLKGAQAKWLQSLAGNH